MYVLIQAAAVVSSVYCRDYMHKSFNNTYVEFVYFSNISMYLVVVLRYTVYDCSQTNRIKEGGDQQAYN